MPRHRQTDDRAVVVSATRHCHQYPRVETEYCLPNIPPLFLLTFYKLRAAGRPSTCRSSLQRES
jgi:hypothetical protein